MNYKYFFLCDNIKPLNFNIIEKILYNFFNIKFNFDKKYYINKK